MRPYQRQKAFGQNFLTDRKAISVICEEFMKAARSAGCTELLEIGPGQGALTRLLATKSELPLLLVEKDRKLIADLKEEFAPRSNVQILDGDFLEVPEEKWAQSDRLGVIGNLPYSAATAILKRLVGSEKVAILHLMFQKEVAQKLLRPIPNRDSGSLGLWIQNQWSTRRVIRLGPGSFRPKPKVSSEVVELIPRKEPQIKETTRNPDLWQDLVRKAFRTRRKMLKNVLGADPKLHEALASSSVDPEKRAEHLGWDEWRELFSRCLETASS